MPDIDSRTELRSIDQKSDTKELLGHYNYFKDHYGDFHTELGGIISDNIEDIFPDGTEWGDVGIDETISTINILEDIIKTYEASNTAVSTNTNSNSGSSFLANLPGVQSVSNVVSYIPGVSTAKSFISGASTAFSLSLSVGSIVSNLSGTSIISNVFMGKSDNILPNIISVLEKTTLGKKYLEINGTALLKIALEPNTKLNLILSDLNIAKIINTAIDPSAADFFETRASQYWSNLKSSGSSKGREEDIKGFESYLKKQVELENKVSSLSSFFPGNRAELIYVVANALGNADSQPNSEAKTKVLKDALKIHASNTNTGLRNWNEAQEGIVKNIANWNDPEILATTTLPEKVQKIIDVEKETYKYSNPIDISLINKIIPLLPIILKEYDSQGNQQLNSEITNLVKNIIGNKAKFGNYVAFGSYSSNHQGGSSWGNCDPVTNAALVYDHERSDPTHQLIINQFNVLIPTVLELLKNETNVSVIQSLIKHILEPRPDSMRFVYKDIMDLLKHPANRIILQGLGDTPSMISNILIDIIQSALVTNNASVINKQDSFLGQTFQVGEGSQQRKLLLEFIDPVLTKVLSSALDPGFVDHSGKPEKLIEDLESLLTKLNTYEQDPTSGELVTGDMIINSNLAKFGISSKQFDNILESFSNLPEDIIGQLETYTLSSTSSNSSSSSTGKDDKFVDDCLKNNFDFAYCDNKKEFIEALKARKRFIDINSNELIGVITKLLGNEYLQSQFSDDLGGNPIHALHNILTKLFEEPFQFAKLNSIVGNLKKDIDVLLNSETLPIGKIIKNNRESILNLLNTFTGGGYRTSFLMHAVVMPILCVVDLKLATALTGKDDTLLNKIQVAATTLISFTKGVLNIFGRTRGASKAERPSEIRQVPDNNEPGNTPGRR
jgi:hypothetical protein